MRSRVLGSLIPAFLLAGVAGPAMAQEAGNAEDSQLAAPLPPAVAWSGASEALIAKPGDPWITPAEQSGMVATATYDEMKAYLTRLADASPLINLVTIGKTALGRDLVAVIATRQTGVTGPADLDDTVPTVLAQAGIHPGESDGTDAGMMLLRDIALRGKADLLDDVNFVFVPIFNVDGHERASRFSRPNQRGPVEQGWRTTAQNINLNRDYIKADAPAMQAMLRLIDTLDPALYLDLHVSDGVDFAYDITFGFQEQDYSYSPQLNAWLHGTFRKEMDDALTSQGHIPGPLVLAVDDRHPEEGLYLPGFPPRFSHSYGDLRHIPAVLVEDHALKPYRQRVLGDYVLLQQSLRSIAEHWDTLKPAIEEDRKPKDEMVLTWEDKAEPVRMVPFRQMEAVHYDSDISGTEEIRYLGKVAPETPYPLFGSNPGVTIDLPEAYWVSVAYPEVIKRLREQGVEMEVLEEPRTVDLDMIRISDPEVSDMPLGNRIRVSAGGYHHETLSRTFMPGSVRVPTDQPLGQLAAMMLELQADDSLFQWGFFMSILTRTSYIEGYVVEPMAREMMERDPALKAEFEAKLAEDAEFAADPDARLNWFYERSPYYDSEYLLYPVGREISE
ncbi:M14 family metallopeptidase [Altericroceibacterium endophyticum]|uniref:Carboxypeptidase n=1 Tax=Altericroceibacterium endophyticum TaxID=1808508 RepID=A0A6I4TBD9_9SPHN|nr:M14 family metallopeptidase [Altericroceibacterium endophyticum]MXO67055.1 carboxypeptidase [Altericroceibacterium endophyticum]